MKKLVAAALAVGFTVAPALVGMSSAHAASIVCPPNQTAVKIGSGWVCVTNTGNPTGGGKHR